MSFTLKGSNPEFSERQKNVFDQLKVIENNRINTSLTDEPMEIERQPNQPDGTDKKRQRSITKHFRGKESIFKKPQNLAPKRFINQIPDFKRNPHKWTKYTLTDVKEEDMSEKGNTNAAFSFLKQLQERKNLTKGCDAINMKQSEQPSKIIFKSCSSLIVKSDLDTEAKPSFKSSKVVMPEYVVGQKEIRKPKKTLNTTTIKSKEVKLDHLLEQDEEEG